MTIAQRIHPTPHHLKTLARTNPAGLLIAAAAMKEDLEGLHAVLDAIESLEGPCPVFSEDQTIDVDGSERSYSFIFCLALYADASGKWSDPQRAFFKRLAPLVSSTKIGRSLNGWLLSDVYDGVMIQTLTGGQYDIDEVFRTATLQGNGYALAAVEGLVSDATFNEALEQAGLLFSGVHRSNPQSVPIKLLKSYLAGDVGRKAVRSLMQAIGQRTPDREAEIVRSGMINAYLVPALRQAPFNAETMLDLAGVPGQTIADSFLPALFGQTLLEKHKDLQGHQLLMVSDPVLSLAWNALKYHCAPLIEAAWPIIHRSGLDVWTATMHYQHKSPMRADAFEEAMLLLESKAASQANEAQETATGDRSSVDRLPAHEPFTSAVFALASIQPLPEDWEEKLKLLMSLGANPSSVDWMAMISSTAVDQRAQWAALANSHSRRKEIEILLNGDASSCSIAKIA